MIDSDYLPILSQNFCYRILPSFTNFESLNDIDVIKVGMASAVHDDKDDLCTYGMQEVPQRLFINWHIQKTDWAACFWFDRLSMHSFFTRLYGAHPETKTDFMIRIDSEKNKYELALYRYGLKEPQLISETAYQLLVFKNKFEYYRSDNYNQPRGAWIW